MYIIKIDKTNINALLGTKLCIFLKSIIDKRVCCLYNVINKTVIFGAIIMNFFENALICNVSRTSKILTKQSHGFDCKSRSCHGFVYQVNGKNTYVYKNGISFTAEKDMFLYLPKGEAYQTFPEEDSVCLLINVETSNDVKFDAFGKRFNCYSKLQDNFKKAINVNFKSSYGYQAELLSIVYKIISLVQRESSSKYIPHSSMKKIEPAINAISERYCDANLSVSSLAEMCGMSERYFGRLFCSYYGVYPKQYIVAKRVEEAKILLSDTGESISNISEECGFSNPYYFSRTFKEHVGMSPSEYRKESSG